MASRTPPIAYTDPAAGRAGQLKDITAAHGPDLSAEPWPFPEFQEAVLACLAPDPADRPTAGQLAAALS